MTDESQTRVLLVGDSPGVAQLLRVLPPVTPVGIVAASNRPQYHEELSRAAAGRGIPVLVQPRPHEAGYAAFVEAARALQPDLILCNSYSMILRDDLLAAAPRGGVNIHGGRLPEFRGPNPIQWAIIEGERRTAVTMHEMTPELDAGAVIAQREVPIGFADTWRDVLERLRVATEEMLVTELPAVLAGTATSRPQDEAAAKHRRRRTPEDGRIDWSWEVGQIYDVIRALGDGIPPAFYEPNGERIELQGLSLGDVVALAFDPGPGGRQLVGGGLQLVPTGGELPQFLVLRGGREVGAVWVEPVDLDARRARVRAEPEDPAASALVGEFARSELGLEVEGEAS